MIHPRALVDPSATIGEGTKVWQFASVIRGAVLGRNCKVGSNAIVDGAHLGDFCFVGHGASVNPGFKAVGGVFIGPNAVIANDRWPRVEKDGFDLQALLDGEWVVVAEAGAVIGASAVILPGVTLGAGSVVAAGAVCENSVPPRHVHTRNGAIVPIASFHPERRMRWAS